MDNLYKLFRIQCEDLNVLAEMEYNGMMFNSKGALKRSKELGIECTELEEQFKQIFKTDVINISSGDHLSSILYGGIIVEEYRVQVGVFKTGQKVGQPRYKVEKIEHTFDRIVEPLNKSETAKSRKLRESGKYDRESQWSVSEDTLLKLKAKKQAKEIIDIILKYREMNKLKSTYLEGWSTLIKAKHWETDVIHSNLNQCVAETGRLSSTSPNIQNADKNTKKFLISRYS